MSDDEVEYKSQVPPFRNPPPEPTPAPAKE